MGMDILPKSLLSSPVQKQLMVVGMDIHHSRSPGMRSVIGFVASMNQYVGKGGEEGVFLLCPGNLWDIPAQIPLPWLGRG